MQDNATEHIDIGSMAEASVSFGVSAVSHFSADVHQQLAQGAEILQSMSEQEESVNLTKKEKQALKHELFLRRSLLLNTCSASSS